MKALVWNEAKQMDWVSVNRPNPKDNEVLIQVEAVGVCGSEIEGYLGHNSLRVPPLVMGHEFCGRVEELGDCVVEGNGIEKGQKVVVNPLLYCGECKSCFKGLTQLCDLREIIGIHRPGAFAEWVVVPTDTIVPVPETINPYRAALAEPLACSLRATRRALSRHPLANVVIFGAGGIGLLIAMTAKILGASRIMIVDTNRSRLQMALQLGIDEVLNPSEENIAHKVSSVFSSAGVDVVFDAAGFQPTREAAVQMLNPGGTLMNIGLGIDETRLPVNHTIRNEIEILGSFCYTLQDFQDAVGLLVNEKVTEKGWTEVRSLSDGGMAFSDLVAGKVTCGKIILDPRMNHE